MSQKCQIEECPKPTRDRHDLCPMHDARKRRHGDPLYVVPKSEYKPRKDRVPPECMIEGCHQPVHGRSRCNRHYHAWRREQGVGPVNGSSSSLPIEPLLDYVNQRGGWAEVMDEAGVRNTSNSRPREAMRKNVDRALERGTIPVVTADAMIIRLFGVHPFEVYGDAWWTEDIDDTEDAEGGLGVAA